MRQQWHWPSTLRQHGTIAGRGGALSSKASLRPALGQEVIDGHAKGIQGPRYQVVLGVQIPTRGGLLARDVTTFVAPLTDKLFKPSAF
jgi:hypothetical protein